MTNQLIVQCELELIISLVLLSRARLFGFATLLVSLAALELLKAFSLCLGPRVVIVRGRHVEAIDTAILRMMMRATRVLHTLVNVGRAFIGDLPLGAASLSSLCTSISSNSFPTTILLLVAAATLLFTRERYALG